MSSLPHHPAQNLAKVQLRHDIKQKLSKLTKEEMNKQSEIITNKILSLKEFQDAKRVSIFMSTDGEVNTTEILKEIFRLKKLVYVPTYKGSEMAMVSLKDMNDYDTLPLTKWNIKQPNFDDVHRENAIEIDDPIELFIMPGVAFTISGKRCGYGRGYYDKYLASYFSKFDRKKTKLYSLGFQEQVVQDDKTFPIDSHDVLLDGVVIAN